MDFVISLPECKLKNAIFMVVDCLAKDQVYISYSDKDEEIKAKVTTKMLPHNVWQKYGLPSSVVLD